MSKNTKETNSEIPDEEKESKEASVPLSEEFQARTLDHLKGASKHELNFVSDQVNEHRDKLREKEETEKPVSMDDYKSVMKD